VSEFSYKGAAENLFCSKVVTCVKLASEQRKVLTETCQP